MRIDTKHTLEIKLEDDRKNVIRSILIMYISITLIAFAYLVITSILDAQPLEFDLKLPLTIVLLSSFVLALLYYRNNSSIYVWFFIVVIQYIFSLSLVILFGTTQGLSFLVLSTIIYSSSIIFSWKFSRAALFIFVLSVVLINLFHQNGFNLLEIDYLDSNPMNTLVLIFFLVLNYVVARVGYNSLEELFQRTLQYAEELEKSNRRLDEEVRKRTKQLEKTWKDKILAVERFSTIGKMSSTLLHDIRTPLSSLSLSIDMMSETATKKDMKHLISVRKSYEGVIEIMDSAERLMKNKEDSRSFMIDETIGRALEILESRSRKSNVRIEAKIPEGITCYGVESVMMRIILNLLMNSIETLEKIEEREREIVIEVMEDKNSIVCTIRDNGEGISQGSVGDLFKEGFSLKSNEQNYGLGLFFVRTALEKYFSGKISVTSEIDSFTHFQVEVPNG